MASGPRTRSTGKPAPSATPDREESSSHERQGHAGYGASAQPPLEREHAVGDESDGGDAGDARRVDDGMGPGPATQIVGTEGEIPDGPEAGGEEEE